MNEDQLRQLLAEVREGAVDIDAALTRLRHMPFEDLGFAKVDHHRALRQGMPEVILAKGKTPQQVSMIAGRLLEVSKNVLITRADAATQLLVGRVVFVAILTVGGLTALGLLGVPWTTGFSMKYVNYTIIVFPAFLIFLWIYWHVSVKNWFTGPKHTIDILPETPASSLP